MMKFSDSLFKEHWTAVESCSLHFWYEDFKSVTIKSEFIKVPKDFIKFLKSGKFIVSDEHNVENIDSDDEVDWGAQVEPETSSFPEFSQLVKNSISSLGGLVFPKLSWKSPYDASWMLHHSLPQCNNFTDVLLLLKSSQRIGQILSHPQVLFELSYKTCDLQDEDEGEFLEDIEKRCDSLKQADDLYTLCLREWTTINRKEEFRCFVKNNALIGISQRYVNCMISSLTEDNSGLIEKIQKFFRCHMQNKFALSSYVFDIIVPKKGSILLVDISPFMSNIDAILYSWDELTCGNPEIFKYVNEITPMEPVARVLPLDLEDLMAGNDPFKMIDLIKMEIQKPGEDDSDEDDIIR